MNGLPMEVTSPDMPSEEEPGDDTPYRVWWIPQVPGKPFHILARDLETAHALTIVLAQYDLFQYEHRIKPDYSNTGGIEFWDGTEWSAADDEAIEALESGL